MLFCLERVAQVNARGPSWLQTGRNELIGFEVVGRAVPYVRMTQREAAMAKGGAGRKTRQINRYWDWKSLVGWEAKRARVRMLPKDRLVTVRCRFFCDPASSGLRQFSQRGDRCLKRGGI